MLTVTIRIETLGYEDDCSTDITRKLVALGHITWRGPTLFLEYRPEEHRKVFSLLNSADAWVQAVALEKVEANYGHGDSALAHRKEVHE